MKIFSSLNRLVLMGFCSFLLSSCQTLHDWYQAGVCNTGSAKSQGFDDARYGRMYQGNYGSGCDDHPNIAAYRAAYNQSYQLGLQQRRLDIKQQEYNVRNKEAQEQEKWRREHYRDHRYPSYPRPGQQPPVVAPTNTNNIIIVK